MTHRVAINPKTRPYVEIIEPGSGGIQVTAVVYGDTKEEATMRAELMLRLLDFEKVPLIVRRQLQLVSMYHWAHKRNHERSSPYNIFALVEWLIACLVEPELMGKWLRDNFESDSVVTAARLREVLQ